MNTLSSNAADALNTLPCPCGSGRTFRACCGGRPVRPPDRVLKDPKITATLQDAHAAMQRGELQAAEEAVRRVLKNVPGHLGALSLLALLRTQARDSAAVNVLLQRMVTLYPENDAVLFDYGSFLAETGHGDEAEPLLHRLVERNHRHAAAHNLLGQVIIQNLGTLESAEFHLRQAYYLQPAKASYNVNLAKALRLLGRWDEAMHFLRIALALEPNNVEALLGWVTVEESRHNLEQAWTLHHIVNRIAPDDVHVRLSAALLHRRSKDYAAALAILDTIDGQQLPVGARSSYYYERGQVLDRMARYAEAFAAFDEANRLTRQDPSQRYDPLKNAERIARLKTFFTRERLKALPRGAAEHAAEPAPIFIVGFPRSGTSMIEQILSAHPAISAGGELVLAQRMTEFAAQWLESRLPYPECLADLAQPAKWQALQGFRNYYLNEVRNLAILDPGGLRFTDKMPLNEVNLGLLSLVFPDAPIVHLIRHPLDILTSCYFNELHHGDHFATDLTLAARHYVLVMDLVEHYRRELDIRYLPLRYEDVVNDIETESRRLVEFIGEPWDARCAAFHENRRKALTASYEQVTEKVYTRSVYRYRHYREQLRDVIPIIAPVAERLGYSVD